MTETEIKLIWRGTVDEARERIERAGYRMHTPRTLEIDQLFDRASGELRQSDQILRLRRDIVGGNTQAIVTYKGPATRETYKSREEIEFNVSDPDAFELVLDRLGYQPGFRYEKYRTQFRAEGQAGVITLDETPIAILLELEGPEYWIDSTAGRLGFSKTDFLTASYALLYRQYQAAHPGAPSDMTFEGLRSYETLTKQP
jgi:adenylate cyclase class 2